MKTLKTIGIVITLVCLTAASASADLITGLAGYWTFDETNGAILHDSSGHGFNGTLIHFPNGQGNWTSGQTGGALQFGGFSAHEYVSVPNFTFPTNSMTLTAWVWADSTPYWATIAANWNGAWGAFNYATFGGSPSMSLYVADAYVQEGGINVDYGVSSTSLSVNQWHFLAFVANSQTGMVTFMQDGAYAGSFRYLGGLLASSSQLNIGDDPSDTSPGQGNWDGKIGDLAIWDRALSTRELAGIYNAGLAGQPVLSLITPTIVCPEAQTVDCDTLATVTAQVGEPDGAALTVVWGLNGTTVQTNLIPASNPPMTTNVSFTAVLPRGTNLVEIAAANSLTNTAYCSTTVTVVATPPVIDSISASPSVLWPPNHQMVTVAVNAVVTGNCGPATWKIIGVQSNEPVHGSGGGNRSSDWQILDNHTVALRAERLGTGSGRIYTITIQAEDVAGNLSTATVTVTVPKSMGKIIDSPVRRLFPR